MTDVFAQQGITFNSASMASTSPSATPAPIPAGKPMSQDNAATVLDLYGGGKDSDAAPQQSAPQSFSQAMAGGGNEGAGAAGVAPPQPPTPQQPEDGAPVDVFQKMGITPDVNEFNRAPSITQSNQDALTSGVTLDVSNKPYSVDNLPPTAPVGTAVPSKGTMSQADFGARTAAGDTDSARAAQYAIDTRNSNVQLATKLYGEQKVNEWLNNPIGPVESIERVAAQGKTVPFEGGVIEAGKALQLTAIASKSSNHEPLSQGEQSTVDKYIQDTLEEGVRGYTRGGKLAASLVTLPAWMIEYASGEALEAKAAVFAAKAINLSGAAAPAINTLAKIATTSAFMPTQYVAGYAERQLNASTALTDKGQLIGKQSMESPAMSLFMSYGFVNADVASAMAAPGINKYVIEPGTKLLSTPIVSAAAKLPIEVQQKLYAAYKAIDPNATFSKLMTPDGYSSVLSAVGSFQLDKILRSSVEYAGTDMKFSDYVKAMPLNEDDLLVAGALTAIHGGISSSGSIMRSILQTKGIDAPTANEITSQHSALEQDAYVNQNLPIPKSPNPRGVNEDNTMSPGQLAQHLEDKAAGQDTPEADDMRAAAARVRATGFSSAAGKYADPVVYSDKGDTEAQMVQADMNVNEQANPPLVQEKSSFFNQAYENVRAFMSEAYSAFVNTDHPIEESEKIAAKNGMEVTTPIRLWLNLARYASALADRHLFLDTTEVDDDGRVRVTGKGIKPIYDDFDNATLGKEPDMKTRHQDFDDFMIAQRLLEEAGSDRDVLVTPEQKQKSVEDLSRLAEKYGDDFHFFDTFADEVRGWDNRILQQLARGGLKTQAWVDSVINERSKYSPLQRLIDQGEFDGISNEALGIGANPSANRIGSTKQFKGSSLDIRNTLESRIINNGKITQSVALNLLRQKFAGFAKFIPEITVSDPAVIRKAVTRTYDQKLRQKLDLLAQHLGVDVKTVDDLGRRTHGTFSPMEKLVQLRLGSSDAVKTHELGHALDEHLGLGDKMLSDPKVKAELEKLADDRVNSKVSFAEEGERLHFEEEKNKVGQKFLDYVKEPHELIANFFDAYVNSAESVNRDAPLAKAMFEKILDESPDLGFVKDIQPSTARATETLQREMLDMQGPRNSLPFYENGKLKYLTMPKDVYRAFTRLKPSDLNILEKMWNLMMAPPKALLQFGATHNLDFMLRHFDRGTILSFINSSKSLDPRTIPRDFVKHLGGVAKGIFAVLGRTRDYQEWASTGSFKSIMDVSPEGAKQIHEAMFPEQRSLKTWVDGMHRVMSLVDQPQRIAIYKKLISQGYSELEAGLVSRDASGNYGRGGYISKKVNKVAPFFNDMVQGADRFFRSQFGKNAAAFTVAATTTMTLPQLFFTGYYLWAADDDTRREYLNFTTQDRSTYMHVKVDGVWQQIPRPFAPGFVYGAIPEMVMIHLFGKDAPEPEHFWRELAGGAADSLSPVTDWTRVLPPHIKAQLEATMNYSLFRQQQIFKGDKETTPPEQQFDAHTSETAKMIGKALGISPANIDNTVNDMSGRLGRYLTSVSDAGINAARKAEGMPVAEKPTNPTDNPIYGGLIANAPTGARTESYKEFREHDDNSIKATKQFSGMEGQEADDYQQKNQALLEQHDQLESAHKQINSALKQIRNITQDTDKTGDEKAAQIKDINDNILSISEDANKQFRDAKGQK